LKKLVISDLHLGHENIIKYCNRPFKNAEEMSETIISNWNGVATDEDTVYMLGDWAFGRGSLELLEQYLPRLKGKIIMIRGNHDRQNAGWYKALGVKEVHGCEYWKYKPYVLLSHRPYPTKAPYINVHGHIHNNLMTLEPTNVYVNVSVEAINYTPVDLDELIKKVKNNEQCSTES
jgi:calcineurin-like phosphoesterase family protein